MRRLWININTELKIWQRAALPGLTVLILVILARITGSLQVLEWMLLDTFLRLRPPEPVDERVVIIGINDADIAKIGQYPVPDKEIASLLNNLETYSPRVIGLDIFKDVTVPPGHEELVSSFKNNKNIIGIEKVLHPAIAPPPTLISEPERVGIVDVIPDNDAKYRRYILYSPSPQNLQLDKFSLGYKLAKAYLEAQGITDSNGQNDPDTIQFGAYELPSVSSNFGGYVGLHGGELQVLINFRRAKFRTLSLNDIKAGKFEASWLRDKIVLIGNIHNSAGESFYTSAIPEQKIAGQIYGVEYHAHAISQILAAVLDGRPMLKAWAKPWEYIWIIVWGIIPISIGRLTQSVWKNLLGAGVAGICLISIGYVSLLFWGVWIPIAPSLLTLAINGVGLSAFAFYQHDKLLRSKIDERQHTIKYAFNLIHAGPLQTLANSLHHLRAQDIPHEQIISQFEELNLEIRKIGDFLEAEALTHNQSLLLGSKLKIDLKRPINDLFYEVYSSTLERKDLKNFETLKVKTRSFDPIDDKYLNIEQKAELCQFLEEALCNVGKHAYGVKRVQASGTFSDGYYTLRIEDNGLGMSSDTENKGTKQSKNLAKKLNGKFKRSSRTPRGTVCELSWAPLKSHSFKNQKKVFKFDNHRLNDEI
ncbi:putative Chase2 sensor protein (plasmid) [Calothrix sp. NIES-4071]|nr:putative Chase2 sensor protein [Calothrix sp. NIES-4071]BAZ64518.1 putative Chase2 sensor protein [Calothrix sp. NIES-4105]